MAKFAYLTVTQNQEIVKAGLCCCNRNASIFKSLFRNESVQHVKSVFGIVLKAAVVRRRAPLRVNELSRIRNFM